MDEFMAALLQGMPSPEETAQMVAKFQRPPQQQQQPEWMQGMPSPEETAKMLQKYGIDPNNPTNDIYKTRLTDAQQDAINGPAYRAGTTQANNPNGIPDWSFNPIYSSLAGAGSTVAKTMAIPLNLMTGLDVSGQFSEHQKAKEEEYVKRFKTEPPLVERMIGGTIRSLAEMYGIGRSVGGTGYQLAVGLNGYDDGLKEAKEAGLEGIEKHAYAAVNAASELLTERIPWKEGWGGLAQVTGIKNVIKNRLWHVLVTGGQEAAEESINQIIQNANAALHGLKPWSEVLSGVGEAAGVGGLTGGIAAGIRIAEDAHAGRVYPPPNVTPQNPQNPQGTPQPVNPQQPPPNAPQAPQTAPQQQQAPQAGPDLEAPTNPPPAPVQNVPEQPAPPVAPVQPVPQEAPQQQAPAAQGKPEKGGEQELTGLHAEINLLSQQGVGFDKIAEVMGKRWDRYVELMRQRDPVSAEMLESMAGRGQQTEAQHSEEQPQEGVAPSEPQKKPKLTAEQKRILRDKGFNDSQIRKMTPDQVQQALSEQPAPVEQPAVPHEPPQGEKPTVAPESGNVDLRKGEETATPPWTVTPGNPYSSNPPSEARQKAMDKQAERQAAEDQVATPEPPPAPTPEPPKVSGANPRKPVEQETQQPASKDLPEVGIRGEDLSHLGPSLYRETDLQHAEFMIPHTNSSAGETWGGQVWVSNSPDLAKGQGSNQGVLLEFDNTNIRGNVSSAKPGLDFVNQTSGAVEAEVHARSAEFKDRVKKIIISASKAHDKAYMARWKRYVIPELLKNGWTKSVDGDGNITLTRPGVAAEPMQTPEQEKPATQSLESFASAVQHLANELPDENSHHQKAFIQPLYEKSQRDPAFPKMTLDEFKARLIEANAARHLHLAAIDMLPYLDESKQTIAKDSEISHLGGAAIWHAVNKSQKPTQEKPQVTPENPSGTIKEEGTNNDQRRTEEPAGVGISTPAPGTESPTISGATPKKPETERTSEPESKGLPEAGTGAAETVSESQPRPDRGDEGRRDVSGEPERGAASEPTGTEPTGGVQEEERNPVKGENHVIRPEDVIAPRGDKTKLDANIRAIKLLKKLESENREATPEEKQTLAQYVGWGGLSQVFDSAGEYIGKAWEDTNWTKKWGEGYKTLKSLLTSEEWLAARDTTINAHYTSRDIIDSMWGIVRHLGFDGGRVLELGAGVGHFFGLAPQDLGKKSKFFGVEMDSLSSRIMEKLYPRAKVINDDLNNVNIAPNSVDLVVGNVPFANLSQPDAEKRYGQKMNLHNYFIARALDAVRPGGVVAVISTHHTLDSGVDQRAILAQKGDLIGAIRLPNNAFKENASTEVTTDIIILRKPIGNQRIGEPWRLTAEVPADKGSTTARINEYFAAHPEMVLGENSMEGKMYAAKGDKREYTVKPSGDLDQKLKNAVSVLPAGVAAAEAATGEVIGASQDEEKRPGSLIMKDGKLYVSSGTQMHELVPGVKLPDNVNPDLSKTAVITRAKDYVGLRDGYRSHRDLMLNPESTEAEFDKSLKQLNKLYDKYVKAHGHLDEVKTRPFKSDPDYWLVQSLESASSVMDQDTGEEKRIYSKTDVLSKRIIGPRIAPTKAASRDDAIRISLGFRGRLDTQYMAELTDKTAEQVESDLRESGLAFHNPDTGEWDLASRYLSGNVRKKLEQAKLAAEQDQKYQPNVTALEGVQPKRVPISDITFPLGSQWVPDQVVTAFARSIFGDRTLVQYVPASDSWVVTDSSKYNEAQTSTWGVGDVTGSELLDKALNLNQFPVINKSVEYIDDWGVRKTESVPDPVATAGARSKIAQMQEKFREFVVNHQRAKEMVEDSFNEKFNSFVKEVYDGSHMEFPGASDSIQLRSYQKDAIWRILLDGRALLAHAVGAGKTNTMIGAAMEQRRLGLAKRPLLVVQNATLNQFAKSFVRLYPGAKVLVATSKDLSKERRQAFLARTLASDWDAIVMPQSTFDNLPIDVETEIKYLNEQLETLEEAISEQEQAQGKKSATVKEIVNARNRLQKRINKAIERRSKSEDVVTFEQLGIDSLFLDEAHAYKKPFFQTKLQRLVGLNTEESGRAVATTMKIRHVADKANGRNIVLATGTPVTNTLGEAWHMTNYLAPDVLREFSADTFDRFVGAFTKIEAVNEMNAGGAWVQKQALSKFRNGPELMSMIHAVWDIVTPDMLRDTLSKEGGLPKLKGGKVQAVTVPLTKGVQQFTDLFKKVYDKFKKLSGKEKQEAKWVPLTLYGAGKAAAIDVRMVMPNAKAEAGSKVESMVSVALDEYHNSHATKGTQLIFSDSFNYRSMDRLMQFAEGEQVELSLGLEDLPATEEKSAFLWNDIRKRLVAGGVPDSEIAVVSEYATDAKREALFEKVNSGQVRFMLGSSSKMGVGVNVQKRLVALHHLDTPYLPADYEQREGRIMRFGNLNPEVSIYRYAMAKTIDGALFNKVTRKAKFIWQVLSGKLNGREFDDPASEVTMSLEEQMAAILDDPLYFKKLDLTARKRDLELERESFLDSAGRAEGKLKSLNSRLEDLDNTHIPNQKEAVSKAKKLVASDAAWKIGGKELTDRKEIAEALNHLREAHEDKVLKATKSENMRQYNPGRENQGRAVSENLAQFRYGEMRMQFRTGAYQVMSEGKPEWQVSTLLDMMPSWSPNESVYHGVSKNGTNVIDAVSHLADSAATQLQNLEKIREETQKGIEELEKQRDGVWDKQAELDDVSEQLADIDRQMQSRDADKPNPEPESDEEDLGDGVQPMRVSGPSPLLSSLRKIPGSNKTPVDLRKLRSQHPELTKQEFDQQAMDLQRQGQVMLSRTDVLGKTADEVAQLVYDPTDTSGGGTGDHPRGAYYNTAKLPQGEQYAKVGKQKALSPKDVELQMIPGVSNRTNPDDVRKQIEHDFEVPIYRGRSKGAAGIYKKFTDEIRLKSEFWANMCVLSHEVGHAFDGKNDFLSTAPPNVVQELKGLDYDQTRLDEGEGFAEYIRHFLTLDDAASVAPVTDAYFRGWLAVHPESKAKFDRAREQITELRTQDPIDSILSNQLHAGAVATARERGAYAAFKESIAGLTDHYIDQLHDELHFVKEPAKEAAIKKGVSPERFDAILNRLHRTSSIHAEKALTETGVHTISGPPQKLSESMKEILKPLDREDLDDFKAFVDAKDAIARMDRSPGYNPGKPRSVYEGAIQKIELDPARAKKFDKVARDVRQYFAALLNLQAHEGVKSWDDVRRAIDSMPDYYMPRYRRVEYGVIGRINGVFKSGGGFMDAKSSLRRMGKGSGDSYLDLYEAIVRENAIAHDAAVKYAMIVPFVRLMLPRFGGAEGMGHIMTEVDAKNVMDHVRLEALLDEMSKPPGGKNPLITPDEAQLIKDVQALRDGRTGKKMMDRLAAQYGTYDIPTLQNLTKDVWGAADAIAFWRKDFGSSPNEHIVRLNLNGEKVLIQFRQASLWRAMTGIRNTAEANIFAQMYSSIASSWQAYVTKPIQTVTVGMNPTTVVKLAAVDYPSFLVHSNYTGALERFYAPLQGIGRLVGAMLYKQVHGKFPQWVQNEATIGKIASRLQDSEAGRVSPHRLFSGERGTRALQNKFLPKDTNASLGKTIAENWPNYVENVKDFLSTLDAGMRVPEMLGCLRSHGYVPNTKATPADIEAGKNCWIDPSGQVIDDLPSDMKALALKANNEVLVNFKRKGVAARELDKLVPFFSAAVAGMEKEVTTMYEMGKGIANKVQGKDSGVQNFEGKLAGWAGIATAAALYWWFHHDDDDRKDMDPEIANRFWTFSSGGVTYAKIPKPRGYGIIVNTIEGMLDYLVDGKSARMGEKLAVELDQLKPIRSMDPSNLPAGYSTIYQTINNRDWSGRPIENDFDVEKGIKVPYRVQPYTLETSKVLSQFLTQWIGLSPAKTEYVLNQFSGGLYGDVAGTLENAADGKVETRNLPIARAFAARSLYQRSTKEFYDQYKAVQSNVNTNKLLEVDSNEARQEAERLHQLDRYKDVMSAIRKAGVETHDVAAKQKLDVYSVGVADYALGKTERKAFPNPLAKDADNLPPPVKEARDKFVASLAHSLTGDPTFQKIRTAKQAETFKERDEKHDIRAKWAAGELKNLGYSVQDIMGMVITSHAQKGQRPDPKTLAQIAVAMAQ